MLSLENISYEIAGRWLFRHLTWNITPGEHYGLIGRNGTGKTTLLKIINRDIQPTEGQVNQAKATKIGFLTKDLLEESSDETAFEVAKAAMDELLALETKIARLLAKPPAEQNDTWLHELGDAQDMFNRKGGYEMDAEVASMLAGLGFSEEEQQQPYVSFSGGWRMRVMLARLLLRKPDVLLLDEPTNHLDIGTIRWLEGYLKSYGGTSITVSHDKDFLDGITTQTVEVAHNKLHFYAGNYSKYEIQKVERAELHKNAYENQQKMIADTQKFITRFRAKATKATQVQSRIKMLDKLDRVPPPESDAGTVHFSFRTAAQPGKELIRLRNFTKRYDDLLLFDKAAADLYRGQKVGLIGPNGIGKSTLLRILAGREEFNGTRNMGLRVELAMFAQHQLEDMHGDNTIIKELSDLAYDLGEQHVRDVMGGFMFGGDELEKPIRVLSGGERARVALAKVLLSESNLLLLDEPTNHLDIPSIDVLIQALQQYEGTYVFVSHNRDFLRRATNHIWYFQDKQLKVYPGSFAEFEQAHPEILASYNKGAIDDSRPNVEQTAPQKKADPKAVRRKKKSLQNRVQKLERDMESGEEQQEALQAQLMDPDNVADFDKLAKLQKQVNELRKQSTAMLDEWEQASAELEELE